MRITGAVNDAQSDSCFLVMRELRTQLVRAGFVTRVRRQMAAGSRLTLLEEGGAAGNPQLVACAGWRILENLSCGRHLAVDDLVSLATARSRGHGTALLDWLVDVGRTQRCTELHLDSGVQRLGAHRFSTRAGLDIVGHHFARTL